MFLPIFGDVFLGASPVGTGAKYLFLDPHTIRVCLVSIRNKPLGYGEKNLTRVIREIFCSSMVAVA